jgi:hypothetical protein
MPMIPFMERFPELAARETRSVTVAGQADIPDGEYGFLELFCDEPGCDCRRVMIVVLRSDTELNKIWASINYGWESLDFYKRWGGPWVTSSDANGPFLDPLNPQTPYSPGLLNLFRFLLQSPEYAQRIQTHYCIFRQSIGECSFNSAHRRPPYGGSSLPRSDRHSKTRS